MARKATDLLDIFNYRPEDEDGPKQRRARKSARAKADKGRAKAAKREKAKAPRRPRAAPPPAGAPIVLHRRQLMLGSSVLVLLLVLSFVLGVAAGRRPDGGQGTAPELLRPTGVFVFGHLPKVDNLTAQPTNLALVRRDLIAKYGIRDGLIRTRETSQRYELFLGPFRSQDEARAYFEKLGLDRVKFQNGAPFMPPRFGGLPD